MVINNRLTLFVRSVQLYSTVLVRSVQTHNAVFVRSVPGLLGNLQYNVPSITYRGAEEASTSSVVTSAFSAVQPLRTGQEIENTEKNYERVAKQMTIIQNIMHRFLQTTVI